MCGETESGKVKTESEASSAWAANVKRSTDAVRTVWCANSECWQRGKSKEERGKRKEERGKRKEQRGKRYQTTRLLVYLFTCQLTVFIVFSYRRLSDVMCADRHWKLVYRWISAHITLLAEHPPISGSFLFFSINIIRVYQCHQWERKNFHVSRETGKWKSQRLK